MKKKSLSSVQVVGRIALIVSAVEFLFMMNIESLPFFAPLGGFALSIINALSLVAITTPLIYYLVIRPFILERDEALEEVNRLSQLDPLTQILNRRGFEQYCDIYFSSIRRHRIHGALFLLDLNGFKPVNDVYGHEAGDAVLLETAQRLKNITRHEDIVCRLGGDEFLVFIYHLDEDRNESLYKSKKIAYKLIQSINQVYNFKGAQMQIGVSIGIRLIEFEDSSMDQIIHEADIAMYHAKRSEKKDFAVFEKGMFENIC